MKTTTQNNSSIGKSLIAMMLIVLFTATSAFAFSSNNASDPKDKKTTTEDSVEMEELVTEVFEIEELDFAVEKKESALQVMDAHDNVIFSGSKIDWENQKDRKLVIMKRKAEFLFELNGTQIYKVF